jgi:guanosine-3',5'-bis(diphosphate) 3'-pyrophosphohydrolase
LKDKAKEFATKAHAGQKRKNSDDDYITHPIRVANRIEKEGFSEELVCAAYLHDVVEDTIYEIEDIEKHFGQQVASLVAAHTEDKSKSWKERKQHTIDTIKHATKEVKYLIVADKLDNLIGLEKDLRVQGVAVWDNFNAGVQEQKWYNQLIVQNMYEGLQDDEIPDYFYEYEQLVNRIFK